MLQREILTELEQRVSEMRYWAESVRKTPEYLLKAKPSETGWSALECIDHLNRYSEFYIPVFQKAIEKAKNKTSENYKSGWLGNKMAEDMLPKDGKLKSTMKTFKSKDPSLDGVYANALIVFIGHQVTLIAILEKSRAIDLGSLRVETTISLLKLKLGDALRFFINHEIRHIEQAKKAMHNPSYHAHYENLKQNL